MDSDATPCTGSAVGNRGILTLLRPPLGDLPLDELRELEDRPDDEGLEEDERDLDLWHPDCAISQVLKAYSR